MVSEEHGCHASISDVSNSLWPAIHWLVDVLVQNELDAPGVKEAAPYPAHMMCLLMSLLTKQSEHPKCICLAPSHKSGKMLLKRKHARGRLATFLVKGATHNARQGLYLPRAGHKSSGSFLLLE